MKKFLVIALAVVCFWWFSFAVSQLDQAISRMNQNWLTKFTNATDFMATKSLRRDEASKFFVQYAKEIKGLTPDTSKTTCNFTDLSKARPDLKDIIKEACQLGLFQWSNGKFMPTQSLTNAQAITVLIRMIDWKKDETQWHFAQLYFEKAQELWIMQWLAMNSTANFDKLTTRGDVGILLYNAYSWGRQNSMPVIQNNSLSANFFWMEGYASFNENIPLAEIRLLAWSQDVILNSIKFKYSGNEDEIQKIYLELNDSIISNVRTVNRDSWEFVLNLVPALHINANEEATLSLMAQFINVYNSVGPFSGGPFVFSINDSWSIMSTADTIIWKFPMQWGTITPIIPISESSSNGFLGN